MRPHVDAFGSCRSSRWDQSGKGCGGWASWLSSIRRIRKRRIRAPKRSGFGRLDAETGPKQCGHHTGTMLHQSGCPWSRLPARVHDRFRTTRFLRRHPTLPVIVRARLPHCGAIWFARCAGTMTINRPLDGSAAIVPAAPFRYAASASLAASPDDALQFRLCRLHSAVQYRGIAASCDWPDVDTATITLWCRSTRLLTRCFSHQR